MHLPRSRRWTWRPSSKLREVRNRFVPVDNDAPRHHPPSRLRWGARLAGKYVCDQVLRPLRDRVSCQRLVATGAMNTRWVVLTGALLLAACDKHGSAEADAVDPKTPIAATVDGVAITIEQLDAATTRALQRYKSHGKALAPKLEASIRQGVLQRMIDNQVIANAAKAHGLKVTDADVEREFAKSKARYPSSEAFSRYLEASGRTEETLRDELRQNLLVERVVEKLQGTITVSAERISEHFEANRPRYEQPEQIRAARIVIAGDDDAATRELADRVYKQATAKGTDFGELARIHSRGPEQGRSGELGWFKRGKYGNDFDEVVFKLKPGSVSEPFRTKSGYQIVKVMDRRPARSRELSEVKDTIRATLEQAERSKRERDVIRRLKAEAEIVGGAGLPNALEPGEAVPE